MDLKLILLVWSASSANELLRVPDFDEEDSIFL